MTREIEQLKAQLQQKTQGYHTVVANMCVSARCCADYRKGLTLLQVQPVQDCCR
jgi:hypothetical protein